MPAWSLPRPLFVHHIGGDSEVDLRAAYGDTPILVAGGKWHKYGGRAPCVPGVIHLAVSLPIKTTGMTRLTLRFHLAVAEGSLLLSSGPSQKTGAQRHTNYCLTART